MSIILAIIGAFFSAGTLSAFTCVVGPGGRFCIYVVLFFVLYYTNPQFLEGVPWGVGG